MGNIQVSSGMISDLRLLKNSLFYPTSVACHYNLSLSKDAERMVCLAGGKNFKTIPYPTDWQREPSDFLLKIVATPISAYKCHWFELIEKIVRYVFSFFLPTKPAAPKIPSYLPSPHFRVKGNDGEFSWRDTHAFSCKVENRDVVFYLAPDWDAISIQPPFCLAYDGKNEKTTEVDITEEIIAQLSQKGQVAGQGQEEETTYTWVGAQGAPNRSFSLLVEGERLTFLSDNFKRVIDFKGKKGVIGTPKEITLKSDHSGYTVHFPAQEILLKE